VRNLVVDFDYSATENKEKVAFDLNCTWKYEVVDSKIVDEYLCEVEKIWPYEEFRFSQEVCLMILKQNNYDTLISLNIIKSKTDIFKEIVKSKNLSILRD